MQNKKKINRAAQFMPFAALRGYYDLILEKERRKEERRILSLEQCESLNNKLKQIRKGANLKLEFFRKEEYAQMSGICTKVDFTYQYLELSGIKVEFSTIYEIEVMEK